MASNTLIVRDYLGSLKEDTELDYLFPILLNLMGYKIITTPRASKGQPQFGKDVVAVGLDQDGVKKRFYFELKGHADKDIDDTVFLKPDGIRESLLAAKYAIFKDSSIWGFNDLPVKVVLVHNGILKSNTRPLFEGFIEKEFPDNNFERWDIFALTDYFSEYLFGEYLLTDEESIRLFKRTLVLLDAPDYDYSDFKLLIQKQIDKITDIKSRSFVKFFASMNLLGVILIHYSKEYNNLEPAKQSLTFLVLKIWHWILKKGLAKKKAIVKEFKKLLTIHFELLQEYFKKTLPTTCQIDGLFAERGGPFETIGYPIRGFEYINFLIYFFEARLYYPGFGKANAKKVAKLKTKQREILKTLIRNNIGCQRPIIDSHLIAILNVFIFFFKQDHLSEDDLKFIHQYLINIFDNILITHAQHKRFPELHNNISALIEFLTTKERPSEYEDRSSLLITVLFEIAAIIDSEYIYKSYRSGFYQKINLQTSMSDVADQYLEILFFEKNLYDNFYVETNIDLPEDFNAFRDTLQQKKLAIRNYQTDEVGMPFLRILAHIYFKNEWMPDEWRRFL